MKLLIPLSLSFILALSSCNDKITDPMENNLGDIACVVPIETIKTSLTQKAIDPRVAHLLYREYTIAHPEILKNSDLIQDSGYFNHIEDRLMDFYPTIAYAGFLEDCQEEIDRLAEYFPDDFDNTVDTDAIDTVLSLSVATMMLGFDQADSTLWNAYDTLAAQWPNSPATMSDILNIHPDSQSFKTSAVNPWIVVGAAAGYTLYSATIALWSGNKARNKAEDEYGSPTSDNFCDVARHVYWNMLMRRYTTKGTAAFYAWMYEELHPNACSAHQMDFHNNFIGRNSKYSTFRDKNNTGLYAYNVWFENVVDYVDISSNGIDVRGSWVDATDPSTELMTCEQMKEDHRDNISNTTYIYFR